MEIHIEDLDRHISNLGRKIDGIFESIFSVPAANPRQPRVFKEKDSVTLEIDLPGVSSEGVTVTADNYVLSVKWSRSSKSGKSNGQQSFAISKTADVEGIQAKISHGLLTIIIPMSRESKPHVVKIT